MLFYFLLPLLVLASPSIPGVCLDDPFRHFKSQICHADPARNVNPGADSTPAPSPQTAALHPRNRYNYASPDCSARIHSASEQTQHASSLLHKSRDRYMLTPCKADQHWVIVELCDEIRIEAIELSLWEFYSGVVRDIRLSASDDAEKGFHQVSTFVGRNVRGAQMFTLSQPTAFHRFIRLDFDSFYGSEYYCPVSHLKVFGMNQMEAFKWEQKLNPPRKPSPAVEQTKPTLSRVKVATDPHVDELEELIHIEATRQAANTSEPARGDTSESIYASITRRLSALEGNSSLIAKYIEEQTRIVRATSAALEQDWDEWRSAREAAEDASREDRLGKVVSLCAAMELERQAMATQLRLLAEELNYERRRGFAHTAILILIIGLGAVTRSSVIENVLKPLIAEARRRKDSLRPMPMPNPRRWSRNIPRRPGTPNKRRPYPSNGRSFSSADPFAPNSPHQGAPFRRLAQSAHLHQVKNNS